MVRRALKTLPFCGAYTALLWCSHCLSVVLTLPFCCAHTAVPSPSQCLTSRCRRLRFVVMNVLGFLAVLTNASMITFVGSQVRRR